MSAIGLRIAAAVLDTMTYGPPVRDAAIKLFQILAQTPFRYVIVDCDSNPLYDQLSLAALEYAQTGLAVLTPDIKGYEFWKAQLSWLGTSDAIHMDQYLKIANPVGKYTLLQDARALFGGFAYELPYTPQAAEKMAAGELLTGLNTATAGVVFEQQISRLADQIEEAEHEYRRKFFRRWKSYSIWRSVYRHDFLYRKTGDWGHPVHPSAPILQCGGKE